MAFEQRSGMTNVTSVLKRTSLLNMDYMVQDDGKATHQKVISGIQVRYAGSSDQHGGIGAGGNQSESGYFLKVDVTNLGKD